MNRPGVGDHLAGNVVDTEDPTPTDTPVIDAGQIGGLISALVVAVVTVVFEVVAKSDLSTLGQSLTAVVGAAGALLTYLAQVRQAKKATTKVTPLSRPRDSLGRRLVVAIEAFEDDKAA